MWWVIIPGRHGELTSAGGFTRLITSTRGGGTDESGSGGRRPATAPGAEEREARRKKVEDSRSQKAYCRVRIPASVNQKVYRIRVIVSSREKRGCMIRTYSWRVR